MHPALSVIAFTVFSGAGLGLIVLTVIFTLMQALAQQSALTAMAVALALTTLGLLASTFHLANPVNAWRAFSRFRTSWLSREGIFAVLLYPFAGIFVFSVWSADAAGDALATPPLLMLLAGIATLVLALATLLATGMIYACLRTIPQWNNALVPAAYVLLGLASGAILLLFFNERSGAAALVALVLLSICAIVKALYYIWLGTPQGPTINTALNIGSAKIRLLDIGHSAGTFNTREFGFRVSKNKVILLRWLVLLLGFAVPGALCAALVAEFELLPAVLALAALFAGLFIERWLFFAEARHAVNLFHGEQHL